VSVLLWSSTGDQHPLLQALTDADAAHVVTWLDTHDRQLPPRLVSQAVAAACDCLPIAPPPRLLLLGAGPEATTLIATLRELGWRIDVIEHRARYLSGDRLNRADRVIAARPSSALSEGLVLDHYDAALCATHLFDEDRDCLKVLADSAVPMLGLLGPPARRDELLAELAPECVAKLGGRLESPVGLILGAHGPAAVALSIAARLTQRFGHV
jgi:xanthine dehydrogenase accessory factor